MMKLSPGNLVRLTHSAGWIQTAVPRVTVEAGTIGLIIARLPRDDELFEVRFSGGRVVLGLDSDDLELVQ